MPGLKFQLMVLGTGSHAGKSLLAAALCRILSNRHVKVAPFKAQNMALNAGIAADGAEIGRAQLLQAEAARCLATADMNPVLLKPLRGRGSQVILKGKARGIFSTREYFKFWPEALRTARRSYETLASEYQALVLEGAGSPAEVNLAHRDLANIETARFSKAPWILVSDIERGGSFASVLGTLQLVPKWMRPRLAGVVFNKFRGDASLLKPGIAWLKKKHGVRTLGVLPWMDSLHLDQEDSLGLPEKPKAAPRGSLKVEVLLFDSVANFSDLAPLQRDPQLHITWRRPGGKAASRPDIVVLPGSKHTLEDMQTLKLSGEAARLRRLAGQGTLMLGLCGGMQMLGLGITDEQGVDGRKEAKVKGLGLLDLSTRMDKAKVTRQSFCSAVTAFGRFKLKGYEIHHGRTSLGAGAVDCAVGAPSGSPWLLRDASGKVWGSYLHGLLDNDAFRTGFLKKAAALRGKRYRVRSVPTATLKDAELQRWSSHVAAHLDLKAIKGFPR